MSDVCRPVDTLLSRSGKPYKKDKGHVVDCSTSLRQYWVTLGTQITTQNKK